MMIYMPTWPSSLSSLDEKFLHCRSNMFLPWCHARGVSFLSFCLVLPPVTSASCPIICWVHLQCFVCVHRRLHLIFVLVMTDIFFPK
jgi:hypothetical protein